MGQFGSKGGLKVIAPVKQVYREQFDSMLPVYTAENIEPKNYSKLTNKKRDGYQKRLAE